MYAEMRQSGKGGSAGTKMSSAKNKALVGVGVFFTCFSFWLTVIDNPQYSLPYRLAVFAISVVCIGLFIGGAIAVSSRNKSE